jgi:hypothetical protein
MTTLRIALALLLIFVLMTPGKLLNRAPVSTHQASAGWTEEYCSCLLTMHTEAPDGRLNDGVIRLLMGGTDKRMNKLSCFWGRFFMVL